MNNKINTKNQELAISEKELEILQSVRNIKYGTVLVVINNSEVMQIEATNKKRFDLLKVKKQDENN